MRLRERVRRLISHTRPALETFYRNNLGEVTRIEFFDSKKFYHGVARVVDITPNRPKLLENGSSAPPILFVTGWGGSSDNFRSVVAQFAAQNRRVITIDIDHSKFQRYPAKKGRAQLELIDEVNLIKDVLSDRGVENFDIICQSRGAIVGTYLADKLLQENSRQNVRSIILTAPAGLLTHDTFLPLALRFGLNGIREFFRVFLGETSFDEIESIINSGKNFMQSILSNPSRQLRQASKISTHDIRPILERLRDKNVFLAILAPSDDLVFQQRYLKVAAEELGINFFPITEGTGRRGTNSHNAPFINWGAYSAQILEILNNLDKR